MDYITKIKDWAGAITELGIVVVALVVTLQILLSMPVVTSLYRDVMVTLPGQSAFGTHARKNCLP